MVSEPVSDRDNPDHGDQKKCGKKAIYNHYNEEKTKSTHMHVVHDDHDKEEKS